MKISVIIPTHNRSDALAKTLDYLSKQQFDEQWETIVVNNNSTDDTDTIVAKMQQSFPVNLKLIHEEIPGPAAARNAGAREARGEYLVIIDNDILTEPDFLQRHYNRLRENPNCWIINQVVNLPEQRATAFGKFREQIYQILPVDSELIEVEGITGQGSSMQRTQFKQLGGFDENFFVASGEDRELGIRAKEAGIKIFLAPDILVQQNDWAGTSIRDYCLRQRIYKQTEPFFWQKHGNSYYNLFLVKANNKPNIKEDGLKLFVWKHIKGVLGSNVGQKIIIGLCELVEKLIPAPVFLWRLYQLALAGAIYRGFQEGLIILQKNRLN